MGKIEVFFRNIVGNWYFYRSRWRFRISKIDVLMLT